MVSSFWIVDWCPQVDVQTLFFRLAPPTAEQDLRVTKLNAQKASLALTADYVFLNVNWRFHKSKVKPTKPI